MLTHGGSEAPSSYGAVTARERWPMPVLQRPLAADGYSGTHFCTRQFFTSATYSAPRESMAM